MVKMKIIGAILISLVLLFGVNGEEFDDNHDDDNDYGNDLCEASDNCAYYSSMDKSCACHHRQFPSKTLEQRYGENIKKCCNFHGYRFHNENCEVDKTL